MYLRTSQVTSQISYQQVTAEPSHAIAQSTIGELLINYSVTIKVRELQETLRNEKKIGEVPRNLKETWMKIVRKLLQEIVWTVKETFEML